MAGTETETLNANHLETTVREAARLKRGGDPDAGKRLLTDCYRQFPVESVDRELHLAGWWDPSG